jgi:hypothetical protein
MGKRGPKHKTDAQKLATKIVIGDGCWEWAGAKMPSGRGKVMWRGRNWLAYRAVYTWLIGPIPDGLTLDHLCRNPGCVKPGHLEPVSGRVNTLRGDAPTAINSSKTHCQRGHELAGANLVASVLAKRGQRLCRTCHNERVKMDCRRKRAAKIAALAALDQMTS